MRMNRIFFDIKYRADIEAGRYWIETRDGRSARILAWDIPGDHPIVVAYGTEGDPNSWYVDRFTENGISMEEYYSDLFLVPAKQKLTEFEQAMFDFYHDYVTVSSYDNQGDPSDCFNEWKNKLLNIARKEIEKEQKPVDISPNQFDGITYGMQGCSTENPVEWSEEDEEALKELLDILSRREIVVSDDTVYLSKWLKYIRPQPIQLKEAYRDGFQTARHAMALAFMNYLDENRPKGKMSLSNGECKDIDKAFKEGDWGKIMRYVEKYKPAWKPSEEQMKMFAMFANLRCASIQEANVLESLYKDLKKL